MSLGTTRESGPGNGEILLVVAEPGILCVSGTSSEFMGGLAVTGVDALVRMDPSGDTGLMVVDFW